MESQNPININVNIPNQQAPEKIPDLDIPQARPSKPQKVIQKVPPDCISKRIGAVEVYGHLKTFKQVCIIAIVGFFGILLISKFGMTGSAIATVGLTGYVAYNLYKKQNEMRRLEQIYGINPQTGQ